MAQPSARTSNSGCPILVPEAAAGIKVWAGRLNAAGWAYADYELAKSIGEWRVAQPFDRTPTKRVLHPKDIKFEK